MPPENQHILGGYMGTILALGVFFFFFFATAGILGA